MGPLKNLVVSRLTQIRYDKAFTLWMKLHSLQFGKIPDSNFELDQQISSYIEAMWEEGEGRALIADTLSGIQHKILSLRHQFPSSWRLYKAWGRHELPARAPPLTQNFVHALAGKAFEIRRGDIAVAILVGFDALLRTGELVSLTKQDVDIAPNFATAVLNLGYTKAGSRIGSQESVTLDDPKIIKNLAARVSVLQPGDLLLPKGPFEFRRCFKQLLCELHLESMGFKPYSLRRGGATHHFRSCGQLSRTVVKGRWTNARTARVYINEGLAVLAGFACPECEPFVASALAHFNHCTKLA